jgi:hypothetical protein
MRSILVFPLLLLLVIPVAASTPRPVSGFWFIADAPGTGYFFDVAGDTVVLAVASYEADGRADWRLASGSIVDGVFEASLIRFSDGACPSCPYRAPLPSGGEDHIRVEFVATTRAWMRINDGPQTLIRRFEFGGGWLALTMNSGRGLGPVLAPALVGTWAIAGPDGLVSGLFDFNVGMAELPNLSYWGALSPSSAGNSGSAWGVECLNAAGGAECDLMRRQGPSAPLQLVARVPLIEISPDAVAALPRGGFQGSTAMHKVPSASHAPEIGFWFDPEASGSGWFIDRVNDTLVVKQASYDTEGRAEWRLAIGLLDGDRFEAPLILFRNGPCFNCEYRAPGGVEDGKVLELVFRNNRQLELEVDGVSRKLIRFEFGSTWLPQRIEAAPGYPDIALPDLAGRWLIAETGTEDTEGLLPRIVTIGQPESDFLGGRSWRIKADGEIQMEVGTARCSPLPPTALLPQCELEFNHWWPPTLDPSPIPREILIGFLAVDAGSRGFSGVWRSAPRPAGNWMDFGGTRPAYGFRLDD